MRKILCFTLAISFYLYFTMVSSVVFADSLADGKAVTGYMSENKAKIYCYHGSPGTGEDFELVAKHIQTNTLIAVQRKGYPLSKDKDIPLEGEAFSGDAKRLLLGYSWGSLAVLRDAVANIDKVKAVILVSPYLGGKNVGGFKKFLMTCKFPGHTILGFMTGSIIDKLLDKSSAPKPVPYEYKVIGEKLKKVEVLARSVMEKADAGLSAEEACTILKKKNIPVLLIVGKEDKNDNSQKYGKDIETWLSPSKTLYVEDGGHALLWTHHELLGAEISAFLDSL